jgi:hypothetical protein
MRPTASPSFVEAPWRPEYERLAVHYSSCPTCTAVDEDGVNLKLPCSEGDQVSDDYRQACRRA